MKTLIAATVIASSITSNVVMAEDFFQPKSQYVKLTEYRTSDRWAFVGENETHKVFVYRGDISPSLVSREPKVVHFSAKLVNKNNIEVAVLDTYASCGDAKVGKVVGTLTYSAATDEYRTARMPNVDWEVIQPDSVVLKGINVVCADLL